MDTPTQLSLISSWMNRSNVGILQSATELWIDKTVTYDMNLPGEAGWVLQLTNNHAPCGKLK